MPYRYIGSLGVRFDSATGLHYMRQRWYDASLQRFISRDALRSNNRYEYAAGSPANLIDKTGLEPHPPDNMPGTWNWFPDNGHSGYNNEGRLPTQYRKIPILPKKKKTECETPFAEGSPSGGFGLSEPISGPGLDPIHKTRLEDAQKPLPPTKIYGWHGRTQQILTRILDLDSANEERARKTREEWNKLSPEERQRAVDNATRMRESQIQIQP